MTAPQTSTWGLWINETKLCTYGRRNSTAGDAWAMARPQHEQRGALTVLKVGVFGDELVIGPFDRDDADFARDYLLEKGAPPTALKVVRHAQAIRRAAS